jgi:hypothetical protein
VHLNDSVDNGDIFALDLENGDFAYAHWLGGWQSQKQQITPLKGWFHALTSSQLK